MSKGGGGGGLCADIDVGGEAVPVGVIGESWGEGREGDGELGRGGW
jgi:hypothetical protein